MKRSKPLAATFCFILLGASATAQDAPLSAIDWLDQLPATPAAPPPEPPTAQSGRPPAIEVLALDDVAARITGIVPPSVTGLPNTLWSGTDGGEVAIRLGKFATPSLRASHTLLYSLLLSEAAPPNGDALGFQTARVDAMIALGALAPATALIESIGPKRSKTLFQRYLDLGLLADDPMRACTLLLEAPNLAPSKSAEIYCAARAGKWDTAILLFGTADALGLLDEAKADALVRFLDPELFEGEAALKVPEKPDALTFSLLDALGQRPAITRWPRIYANADLSERVGWKSQIAAAERLTQTGALPDNQLLGIYTERKAAASGGVWERVRAVATLEDALDAQDETALSAALPGTWAAFRAAGLEVWLANLFAARLEDMSLSPPARRAAFEMHLLSSRYELAAEIYPDVAAAEPSLVAISRGEPYVETAGTAYGEAIATGFQDETLALERLRLSGALGLDILDALIALEAGTAGDFGALTKALARLRAMGLEDTARRAALEILLREGWK